MEEHLELGVAGSGPEAGSEDTWGWREEKVASKRTRRLGWKPSPGGSKRDSSLMTGWHLTAKSKTSKTFGGKSRIFVTLG